MTKRVRALLTWAIALASLVMVGVAGWPKH